MDNSLRITFTFDRFCVSVSHSFFTSLHAVSLSYVCPSPKPSNPCSKSTSHPIFSAIFTDSTTTHFTSLSSAILKTFSQNSIHCLFASYKTGTILISNWGATCGCSLSTSRIILTAHSCTCSTSHACLPHPTLQHHTGALTSLVPSTTFNAAIQHLGSSRPPSLL